LIGDIIRWERLSLYPERSFVRHRLEAEEPLRFARISPVDDCRTKVSIIIPTLDGDRGGYLPRLLCQLEQQTHKEWELLLVLGDRRQGRAINAAAALAKGNLLLTLDDDTELGCPDSIGRLVAAIESDRTIGLAGGINGIPKDVSAFVKRVMREMPRRSTPPITQITDSDLAEHPLLLINKEVFFQVGGENEWIPRGLDPYLRQAFRKAGYRVVVVPGAEYSHLPPSTINALMRQFYRNGKAAAFVNRHYPQWAIETPSMHGPFRLHVAFPSRAVRFLFRQGYALLTGKLIWFLCEGVYALGFLHEWLFPTEQR
jgi:GT2 family glycosyltransferase